jgi:hypothetical protein
MKGFKNGNGNNSNVQKLRPDASPKSEDVKAELFRLRDEITKLVEKDPAKAASLLTQWLNAKSQPASNSSTNSRKKVG